METTFLLSRLQFAANISFHILFPTITIALAWFLLYFKLRYTFSGNPVWMRAYRFWVKIFALTFALGIVSGITMSFQFGTNWPGYMETVGNVAGPLLGYEVLTAFFMEATFLGIMLFGMQRVPVWVHTLATFLVALGTSVSAFWIIALNSWMHTPTGFDIVDGVVQPANWWQIIFNPSMPYRLTHVLLSSGLTCAFLMAGISAYRILKGDSKNAPRLTLKSAVFVAAVSIPLQIVVGDLHGLNSLKHQPQKIAAIEGIWETQKSAPLLLFAVPDEDQKTNHLAVGIPKLASLILTHDSNGEIKGLNDFDKTPPVKPLFYGFRLMVGCGVIMLFLSWVAVYFYWRQGQLPRNLLNAFVLTTFLGWIATLAGWYVTEIGRQPYLVHDILLTADAVTDVASGNVAFSLAVYVSLYIVLIIAYVRTLFYMARRAVDVEEYEMEQTSLPQQHTRQQQKDQEILT